MNTYRELRKELFNQLKARGVQSPAKGAPVISETKYTGGFEVEVAQQEQIDQLRQMLVDIDLTKEFNARQ